MAYYAEQERWLAEAEAARPATHRREAVPTGRVRVRADAGAFQGWRTEPAGGTGAVTLGPDGEAVYDFGEHGVGYPHFRVERGSTRPDAPIRLVVAMGEVPAELAESYPPEARGVCHAWRQEETLILDELPARVCLARRYAFRYLKIRWDEPAAYFDLRLADVGATWTSSAPFAEPAWPELPPGDRPLAAVAARTLRNCMHSVFEDGPKRDRRLWLGDLRLQALVNELSFRDFGLVRRCLFLIAGLADADGAVPGCVHDGAKPEAGNFVVDYAPLFGAALADYDRASGDRDTVRELLPVAARQAERTADALDGRARYTGRDWVFIDWKEGLDRDAPLAGVALYGLAATARLARRHGRPDLAQAMEDRRQRLFRAAREAYWDGDAVVSGPERQRSWAGWAWAALSGLVTRREARRAWRALRDDPRAVTPGGPYQMHHVVDALVHCGFAREARERVRTYWGGMAAAGLTTFPEVWDAARPRLSPYGTPLANSYCHAWSCTAPWLLARAASAPDHLDARGSRATLATSNVIS